MEQRFLVRRWRSDGGQVLGYVEIPHRPTLLLTLLEAGRLSKEALGTNWVRLEWWDWASEEELLLAKEASPEDKETALALGDVTKQGLLQRGGLA